MKLFGTDGIRGKAGTYPITKEVAYTLARALVSSLSVGKDTMICIGRDTRRSGDMLFEAMAFGAAKAGASVLNIGILPSNAVSYFVSKYKCDAGFMISASHNPAEDNGIKVFNSYGFKLSAKDERLVEQIFFSKKFKSCLKSGKIGKVDDSEKQYMSMITNCLDEPNLSGISLAVDAANGAASNIVRPIFEKLGINLVCVNTNPNGANINKNCGSQFPQQLQKLVTDNKLDAGIALDGDADRLIMVDESGKVLDGDTQIAIIACEFKRIGKLKSNTIAVTNYSNIGLDKSLRSLGINVVRVEVGDKHISDYLFKNNLVLGGENSGHVIISDVTKTSDALIAAIQILSIMKNRNAKLSELSGIIKKYAQTIVNIPVKERKNLEDLKLVNESVKQVRKALGSEGRLYIRYSGTENIVRVLVEGKTENIIKELANKVARTVQSEIGA